MNYPSTTRTTLLLALAIATFAGAVVAPAYADDHDRDGRHRQEHRDDRRPDAYHRGAYNNAPPVIYYGAPPVVYAPPGISLDVIVPLFR